MARPLRVEVPGGIFHVWNRGVNRADIVFDDDDRQLFFDLLSKVIRRFGWIIIEPVLMTNHFHLVIKTPEPTLSRGMKWLQQKFVQHINRRYDRVGPLFQGRFKHQLVESGAYLLELLRYVALNPVRAKMVQRTEDYRWSGYRWLAGYETPPDWYKPGEMLSAFGPDLQSQQREFRRFTEAAAGIMRAPWSDAIGQIFIGSQTWVESMRSLIESKPRSTDHPAEQRYAVRPRPAKVVEVVASVFETTPEEIRASHGTIERRVVAWLGCYESMARLGAIGAVLRLRSTSRASELIAECDRDAGLPAHKNLRIALDRCLDLLRREMKPVMPRFREFFPSVSPHAVSPP
ncbi:MAG: transposase [Thermoanaerobaculia bacterium]